MLITLEEQPEYVAQQTEAKREAKAEAIAKFVEEEGREPSPTAKNEYGWTDLHYAVQLNLREVVALLIEKGADVNARDNDGDTPLALRISPLKGDEMPALLRQHGGTK